MQTGTLALTGVGTQEGTFTVSPGATLTFGGLSTSHTTLAAGALVTGGGALRVAQGTLDAPGTGNNNYSGGTTVASGGRANISGAGTALGSSAVTIQSGGVVSIEAAGNLLASQALVQAGGSLAVRSDFIPQALIAATSSGTFAIDTLGFATAVDMSLLGNGAMSLGSTTTGTYTASTLGPGAANTYRLGGGGGTITLTEANVLTGGHPVTIVSPGTVILGQSQDFTSALTIQSNGKLVLNGGLTGGGAVSVLSGGSLGGQGSIAGATTIDAGGTIAPGQSPGSLAFAAGLTLAAGSHFAWQLAAFSTVNPGVDWDQLHLTGGVLSAQTPTLDLSFLGTATSPNGGAPFWQSSHRWHIVDLTGTATNPSGLVQFLINNSPWSQFGNFNTDAAESGLGVDLVWNPVPEPSTWLLLLLGASALCMPRVLRSARR